MRRLCFAHAREPFSRGVDDSVQQDANMWVYNDHIML